MVYLAGVHVSAKCEVMVHSSLLIGFTLVGGCKQILLEHIFHGLYIQVLNIYLLLLTGKHIRIMNASLLFKETSPSYCE